MSKDEYLITDAPLKALTVFAMPMILGSFFQQGIFLYENLSLIRKNIFCSIQSKNNTFQLLDRKSTRLNSSHRSQSRMPSSA